MKLSLRRRILMTIAPALVLLTALAGLGFYLLFQVSFRSDAILRENYDSVRAMERLNEAVERIDWSFQLALASQEREDDAQALYRENWTVYLEQFEIEKTNVTILPVEQELVDHLTELTRRYDEQGHQFFARPKGDKQRAKDYLGTPDRPGLRQTFQEIRRVAGDIHRLNEQQMQYASQEAQNTGRRSLVIFGIGLVVTALLGFFTIWRLQYTIVKPIESMTDAATAIGSGQLHRNVPVLSGDEIGRLAGAFNTMTQRLREYRQTNTDRLLRAQQTGQATIDSFPDPVVVIDPDGRVELANQRARQLLGVEPAHDGKPGSVWQPPDSLRQPLTDALREQRPFLTERFDQAVSFLQEGKDRFFLPQVRPIHSPSGDTLGAAVVLNDVTRFRLLDRLKSDLVATVSHELKTPLTSVRLAIHVLLEEAVGPLEPKQMELLVDCRENTERLLTMIEHLLALARLEHGRDALQARPVSPATLLKSAADAAAVRAEDRHIQVVVEEAGDLPAVSVDVERFDHALNNLMDNALTYTEPGGRVTLSAAAADGRVRISVVDTGVGIPPEFLPHVFDKFFRVPDQSRPLGTGLGLAIVREIVEAHDGEIICESQPGKGTAFHISLPAWRDQP